MISLLYLYLNSFKKRSENLTPSIFHPFSPHEICDCVGVPHAFPEESEIFEGAKEEEEELISISKENLTPR
jgi:hypothetical protein